MALEDFTTYDETDAAGNVTVALNKVSWNNLDRDETSHVSKSMGAAFFNEDFEHRFKCQVSDIVGTAYFCYWQLANAQLNHKALIDASADAAAFFYFNQNFYMRALESGGLNDDVTGGTFVVSGTTYYIIVTRDDDGGVNNTGQYIAEIRTGSHTGNVEDTLTIDCSAGEQNDFEYIFGLASYNEGLANNTADGFTENLDLQIPGAGVGKNMPNLTWGW